MVQIVKEIQATIPLEFDFAREVWFMVFILVDINCLYIVTWNKLKLIKLTKLNKVFRGVNIDVDERKHLQVFTFRIWVFVLFCYCNYISAPVSIGGKGSWFYSLCSILLFLFLHDWMFLQTHIKESLETNGFDKIKCPAPMLDLCSQRLIVMEVKLLFSM